MDQTTRKRIVIAGVSAALVGAGTWWLVNQGPPPELPIAPDVPSSAAGGLITDLSSPQTAFPGAEAVPGVSADGTVLVAYPPTAAEFRPFASYALGERADHGLALVRRDGTVIEVAPPGDSLMDSYLGYRVAFGENYAVLGGEPGAPDGRYVFIDLATGAYTEVTPEISEGEFAGQPVNLDPFPTVSGDYALATIRPDGIEGTHLVAVGVDGRAWLPLGTDHPLPGVTFGRDECTGRAWVAGVRQADRDSTPEDPSTFESFEFEIGEYGSRSTVESVVRVDADVAAHNIARSGRTLARCGETVIGRLYGFEDDAFNDMAIGIRQAGEESFSIVAGLGPTTDPLSYDGRFVAYGDHPRVYDLAGGTYALETDFEGPDGCVDTVMGGDFVIFGIPQQGDGNYTGILGNTCAIVVGRVDAP